MLFFKYVLAIGIVQICTQIFVVYDGRFYYFFFAINEKKKPCSDTLTKHPLHVQEKYFKWKRTWEISGKKKIYIYIYITSKDKPFLLNDRCIINGI